MGEEEEGEEKEEVTCWSPDSIGHFSRICVYSLVSVYYPFSDEETGPAWSEGSTGACRLVEKRSPGAPLCRGPTCESLTTAASALEDP